MVIRLLKLLPHKHEDWSLDPKKHILGVCGHLSQLQPGKAEMGVGDGGGEWGWRNLQSKLASKAGPYWLSLGSIERPLSQ